MDRPGGVRGVVVAVVLVLLAASGTPAGAIDGTDLTGDVTDPTLVSFSVTPTEADVTHTSATFSVALRVTDDFSGVTSVDLGWNDEGGRVSHYINTTRTSGDEQDGTWTGSFTVPRYAPPGSYGFYLSIADRVGNGRSFDADALTADGFPGHFTITDDDPDATPPVVTDVRVSPTVVDVRRGPSTVHFEVDVADDRSGVYGMVLFVFSPRGRSGGVDPPPMSLTAGTAQDGTWTGTATVPRYTHQGRFRIELFVHDTLLNTTELRTDDLGAAGMADGFDVLSEEDVDAPRFTSVSITPAEVNVHDADQTISVQVQVTDDRTGVHQQWSDTNMHSVHISAQDPVSSQGAGVGGMARTSGTALDGVYETTFTVPKSSATGLRPLRLYTEDAVANDRFVSGSELVSLGGIASLLVYNVPLPPRVLAADPGDATATVRWDPPTDDRGAAVTGYVVRESPDGLVKEVDGDARATVVEGLRNDVSHTFTVAAVNKAGASDPSAPVSATPRPSPAATLLPAPAPIPRGSGYWMVGSNGAVYAFGDAPQLGAAPVGSTPAVDIEPTPTGRGYWVVDAVGHVFAFGDAPHLGGTTALAPGEAVTSLSATRTGLGYWLFTTRGRVVSFGDALFLGDLRALTLNGPVLDSIPTPSGRGYYMVASDGGVFAFGDARFVGSMGSTRLNAPVQSLVPDPDGDGYWLVAADGGIFSFHTRFHGSMGSTRLNRPVTGMVGSRTGGGYLMVAEDGGAFAFGDVPFRGSLGNRPPTSPVVAVATLP